MLSVKNVVPFFLLAACAPNTAVLESGQYVALFSEGTSLSLAKEEVDPTHEDFTASYNLDCRDEAQIAPRLRLDDRIPCGPLRLDDLSDDFVGAQHEVWVNETPFRVVSEDITPWRGEAVISAEGDLQIGFHHRMPGGADMRFLFVVDPDFQPTTCTANDDGSLAREPLDGKWIEEWSSELPAILEENDEYQAAFAHMDEYLDDGRLFFLNSTSYQVNPRQVGDFWFLPDQYEAGATRAKFSEELMIMRQSVWGFPYVYSEVDDPTGDETRTAFDERDLWWCEFDEGDDTSTAECQNNVAWDNLAELETVVDTVAEETYTELRRMFRPGNVDPIMEYRPLTHLNKWRTPDGVPAGFDGWGEMHYNYVVFSADSVLEEGGAAEGAFSLAFEAIDSNSHVFVQGKFVIDRIRRDRWVTEDLRAVKAEENGVELCFQQ